MIVPPHLALTLAAAVDEGSLDAAARALHLTPPAVSQRISQLEHITGQVLLVRSRPARATAAGQAVIRYARQVEHLESSLTYELGLTGQALTLPIAVNADSLATWLLDPLSQLSRSHAITFHLHREDQEHTADLLERGVVLAAVTARDEPIPGCSSVPLGAITYRAVASVEFAQRWFAEGITAAALMEAPVVDFDARDDLQTRWMVAMGADPAAPPRHRIPSTADMTEAIHQGLGWGLVITLPRHDAAHGLELLGGPEIAVPLYWQQWRAPSALLDSVAAVVVAAGTKSLTQRQPK